METREAILKRCACRKFTSQQITSDQLQALMDAANAAPVGMGDYSGFELIAVQDESIRAAIDSGTAHAMPMMGDHPTYQAPTLLFICVKPNPQFSMIPYAGASCIAENIMIQATDLGLASVYIMAVPSVMQQKKELLDLLQMRDGFIPAVLVSVGYAAQTAEKDRTGRLSTRIL